MGMTVKRGKSVIRLLFKEKKEKKEKKNINNFINEKVLLAEGTRFIQSFIETSSNITRQTTLFPSFTSTP